MSKLTYSAANHQNIMNRTSYYYRLDNFLPSRTSGCYLDFWRSHFSIRASSNISHFLIRSYFHYFLTSQLIKFVLILFTGPVLIPRKEAANKYWYGTYLVLILLVPSYISQLLDPLNILNLLYTIARYKFLIKNANIHSTINLSTYRTSYIHYTWNSIAQEADRTWPKWFSYFWSSAVDQCSISSNYSALVQKIFIVSSSMHLPDLGGVIYVLVISYI